MSAALAGESDACAAASAGASLGPSPIISTLRPCLAHSASQSILRAGVSSPSQVVMPLARAAASTAPLRSPDRSIAAEGKDDGGGMQRPQAAEARPFEVEIEDGIGKLPSDEIADQKSGDPPEHRGDDTGADDAVCVASLRDRQRLTPESVEQINARHRRSDRQDRPGQHHARVLAAHCPGEADRGANANSEQRRPVRKGVQFLALYRCRHARSPSWALRHLGGTGHFQP